MRPHDVELLEQWGAQPQPRDRLIGGRRPIAVRQPGQNLFGEPGEHLGADAPARKYRLTVLANARAAQQVVAPLKRRVRGAGDLPDDSVESVSRLGAQPFRS